MSGLTPEAARAAAEWLDNNLTGSAIAAATLAGYADRKEAEDRTPGRVLCDAEVTFMDEVHGVDWEKVAAAVIAHHVGPDRIVVDRDDLDVALNDPRAKPSVIDRLREALS